MIRIPKKQSENQQITASRIKPQLPNSAVPPRGKQPYQHLTKHQEQRKETITQPKKQQSPNHSEELWLVSIWVCLKMVSTPLYPMVLLIIISTKWLFHWGYTSFSDIPILYQFLSYIPLPWPWRRHPSAAGLCWRSGASGLEGRLGVGESGGVAGAGAGTPRGPGPPGVEEKHGTNEVKHGWKWMEPEFKVLKKHLTREKSMGNWGGTSGNSSFLFLLISTFVSKFQKSQLVKRHRDFPSQMVIFW